MANFTALAAARHAVLARAGWDVEAKGLFGAPEIARRRSATEAHATIFSALRMLGLGSERVRTRRRPTTRAAMRPGRCAQRPRGDATGPTIVCAQAGNVNTGAFDPLDEIVAMAHARGAWLHVDGAFGLWAAASPELPTSERRRRGGRLVGHRRPQVAERALRLAASRSWRDAAAHRGPPCRRGRLPRPDGGRRARPPRLRRPSSRAAPAASRSMRRSARLGRTGVAEMVERCCRLARRMADRLRRGAGRRASSTTSS